MNNTGVQQSSDEIEQTKLSAAADTTDTGSETYQDTETDSNHSE